MKNIISLMLFLLLSASCAKKDQVTQVDFKSTLASIANGFPGGLMLYGKKSTGEHFGRIIASNELIEEVPNGVWNFYLIGWSGEPDGLGGYHKLSGVTQCAVLKNITLAGGFSDISMNMTNSNCSHPDFGPTYLSTASSETGKIVFMNYLKFEPNPAGTSEVMSARFDVKSFNSIGSNDAQSVGDQELLSECFDSIDNAVGLSRTSSEFSLNYPLGLSNTPFTIHISLYDAAGCPEDERGGLFMKGIKGLLPNSIVSSVPYENIGLGEHGIKIQYPLVFTDIPHD